jgi:hypothetical protein
MDNKIKYLKILKELYLKERISKKKYKKELKWVKNYGKEKVSKVRELV